MDRLSAKQKTEIREAIREDNARIQYERVYGKGSVRRSRDLRPSVLADRYNVTDGQIRYAIRNLEQEEGE